jgi:hypothetical protein
VAPPAETVVGAFVRNVEDQIAALERSAASDPAQEEELADLREVLRLGRHLLEGRQVTL